MKKLLVILATIVFVSFAMICCTPQQSGDQEEVIDPSLLADLKTSVQIVDDWVWEKRPQITINIENPNRVKRTVTARITLATDKREVLDIINKEVTIAANAAETVVISTETDLEPGFYRATCDVDGKSACWDAKKTKSTFVFGISPEKISSPADKRSDFDKFWRDAKDQLKAIDMNVEKHQVGNTRVWLVLMNSVPDGLTGEPVRIGGYYVEPADKSKPNPIIMHYYGYDDLKPTKMSLPSAGSGKYAEFYVCTRGQRVNSRSHDLREDGVDIDFQNTYGDWFGFNFGNKDGYYYRGAFMDCIQAINFMVAQPGSDKDHIYAEGCSQGGAFSYVAAALSDYPLSGIAPGVSFLGDFPDFIELGAYQSDLAKRKAKELWGSADAPELLEFLSYFDMKNLATRISCPVIAYIGLQDSTCPPHTNMAPYNNVLTPASDKKILYYPTFGHDFLGDWASKYTSFFNI